MFHYIMEYVGSLCSKWAAKKSEFIMHKTTCLPTVEGNVALVFSICCGKLMELVCKLAFVLLAGHVLNRKSPCHTVYYVVM